MACDHCSANTVQLSYTNTACTLQLHTSSRREAIPVHLACPSVLARPSELSDRLSAESDLKV
ncbi:hypothetical protein EYF80_034414 [Liparis tanakae]|uniref:Uncharacterized protein n=1 Tax=Liparis tanakae TaxID=230148 RepID=A0A4Z2GPY2_9TELE|nr:hypothetical protein EYF80_034414 [Liparis tanakae]